MAQHAVTVRRTRARHALARSGGWLSLPLWKRLVIALDAALALTVGHFTHTYHGAPGTGQLFGVTFAHVGGCEVDHVDNAVSVGCFSGGND